MPTLDTSQFKEITERSCESLWNAMMKRPEDPELVPGWQKWKARLFKQMKDEKLDRDNPKDRCEAAKKLISMEWACVLEKTPEDKLEIAKCIVGGAGGVEIVYPKTPFVGEAHYHPSQARIEIREAGKRVEIPLIVPYASDEDVPEYLSEFNTDPQRFRYHCIATDDDSVCYDMKDYTPAAWDKAVENVRRDYEQIVLMPLVGRKIGLALMFEDLVKQGVVKKHRVRTGELVKLE